MKNPAYYLFEIFSRFLCVIPKRGMYLFADFLYVIAYYLIGYRKKVVYNNLRNSFPEKSPREIHTIAKGFYKHLADVMVENIAILNMSEKQVGKFTQVKNIELIENYRRQNKNTIALTGHYGNWEFLPTLAPYTDYTILSVYKPLRNKFFDKKVYKMRTRFHGVPVPMKTVYKEIIKREKMQDRFIMGLVSDQCPPRKYINYWTTFLNQETPFFTGAEKIAKKFNQVVVFTIVKKIKRGLYQIEFQPLHENAGETKDTEITEKYVRALEQTIQNNPEYWLWSHRRWKYKKADLN
jgi:KDO2-lipid IV(A) lauroyltransferase